MTRGYGLLRPFLFALEPELAHQAALGALKSGLVPACPVSDPRLERRVLGLDFANPLGMAAGFDKEAEAVDGLLRVGFGFVEVGTTTPRAQPGNPRPRMFRLEADRAVINRLGFNSRGHDSVARNLAARAVGGIVGVNIGANRDASDRIADYVEGVRRFGAIASYITVNISSPNTPGLRGLQAPAELADLLDRVMTARNELAGARPPILLKIAPDLDDSALPELVAIVHRCAVDGMIVANTTLARDGLTSSRHRDEAGGLSGRPLFRRSTAMLAHVRKLAGRELALVGVGGVDSAETAFAKIAAGADLVQLYTGMVYEGPALPGAILSGLVRILDAKGFATIAEAVGSETERWAAE